jgi:hypothetical protein
MFLAMRAPVTKTRNKMNRTKSMAVCTLLLSLAAIPGTASAYKLKETSTGAAVRWHESKISVHIDPALEAMLPAGQARAALGMASDAWRGIGDAPEIVIEHGAPAPYAADKRNNGVYLLNDWPHNPNQLAVTVLTYSKTGEIRGMDVLVNGSKRFELFDEERSAIGANAHDFAAVMTHEFGHVLGLDEGHEDDQATMWPYIRKGEVHQRTLSEDDERGVTEAYAAALTENEVAKAAAACSATSSVGSNGGHGMLGLGLLLGAALRVGGRKRARA